MRSERRAMLLLALVLCLPGCSQNPAPAQPPPKVSTEGQVAIYARQALTVADGVLTELDQLTERRLAGTNDQAEQERIKAQTRTAVGIVREIGVQGQNLATALQAWHAARVASDQKTTAERVRIIVATIRDNIPKISAAFPDPNVRATVVTSLQALTTLLLNVETLVPAPPVASAFLEAQWQNV